MSSSQCYLWLCTELVVLLVKESKTCNPFHLWVHAAWMSEADTDLRLIDITGQTGVSARGITIFTLELTHH